MRRNFLKKIYDLFRYDLPRFFRNTWSFRKELWEFRWYDYHYTLQMMKKSLQVMSDNIEIKGYEVDESRLKKVAKMRRAIQIIDNMNGVVHIEMAEKELGSLYVKDWEFIPEGNDFYSIKSGLTEEEESHNKKVYDKARKLEEEEWRELWSIFQGQQYEKYKKLKNVDWNDWFDGSGMNSWWD